MAVLERIKELEMLMAIGMNRQRIFSMIMLETVFLSITGGILGMVIAACVVAYYHNTGIDLTEFAGKGLEEFGFSAMLYPYIGFTFYFILTLMVIGTAILASLYPARKALKLKPAEAVRTE